MKALVVDTLTVGSQEKPSGITLYDEVTGEPHCLRIRSGEMVSTQGKCESVTNNQQPTTNNTDEQAADTDTEAPVITINGNNPAEISIGGTYSDLGATVTDNVNDNLGITALIDGVEVTGGFGNIQIDTSTSTTYTITYSATDQAGNTSTAERDVIVSGTNTSNLGIGFPSEENGLNNSDVINIPEPPEPEQEPEPVPDTTAPAETARSVEVIKPEQSGETAAGNENTATAPQT
jgi:hypothetical protein